MSTALATGYLALAMAGAATGVGLWVVGGSAHYVIIGLLDIVVTALFGVTALRANIALDELELVVTNTVRVKTIRRLSVIEVRESRFGVAISYLDNGASRVITSPCGMGIAGIQMFGRETRAQLIARELNLALGIDCH